MLMIKSFKGKFRLKFILLSLGVFLLLWYIAPLVSNILNIGNIVGIIACVLIILFAAFYDKLPAGFIKGALIFAAAVLIIVAPISFNMASYANYKTDDGAKTVIVLGCQVNGERPSRFLNDRCKAAAKYLKENPEAVAVLSGGQGPDEGISEAQCMENVLIDMGIDGSRLIKEDKSTRTSENIEFSKNIIDERNLSGKVVIVTNEFHEYRAKLICEKQGLEFRSVSCKTPFYTFLTYYTRELMGIVLELLTA